MEEKMVNRESERNTTRRKELPSYGSEKRMQREGTKTMKRKKEMQQERVGLIGWREKMTRKERGDTTQGKRGR